MRTPMKFSGKPQSYVKQLEARVAALETIVSALVWAGGSQDLADALRASADWHDAFMRDPAARTSPEFVRDWRASLVHVLSSPAERTDQTPAPTPAESDDQPER